MWTIIEILQNKSKRTSCQPHGRETKKEPPGRIHGKTLTDQHSQVTGGAELAGTVPSTLKEVSKWSECPHRAPLRAQKSDKMLRIRPAWKPEGSNLTSKIGVAILLTLLACLLPLCGAQPIICGQESWFYGFEDSSDFEFQAMDSSPDGARVVVGGTYLSNKMVLIAHDMNTGTTLNNFYVSQTDIEGVNFDLNGVLDLKVHLDGTQATALVKPDGLAMSVGHVLIAQFTLGDSTTLRVAYMQTTILQGYTQNMILVRGLSNQIEFLFEQIDSDGSSCIRSLCTSYWRYHIDFATNSYFLQLALQDEYSGTILHGDAVVTPSGKLLMATFFQQDVQITRLKSDQTTGTKYMRYITGTDTGPVKLVAESDDIGYLVTKDGTLGSVRFITMDISDINDEVVFTKKEVLSFTGDLETVIQSAFLLDGEVEIVLSTPAGGYIILNTTRLIRISVDRSTIGGQPWVFASHALINTSATTNSCQYGLGLTHVERICTSEVTTGTACNYFVTTTTENISASVLDQADSTYVVGPTLDPDSAPLEAVTLDTVAVDTYMDLSLPSSSQIVNPCGIELIPFENDSVMVFKDFPSQLSMDYADQVPQSTIQECPDPSVAIGSTSLTFQFEIVELIKPDGSTLVPSVSMVSYDVDLQSITFTQSHLDWVAGQWSVVYAGGFCTNTINEVCRDNKYVTTFKVVECSSTGWLMPTLSLMSFVQGPDRGTISLTGATQGDCPYTLELSTDAPSGVLELQQAIFELQPPPNDSLVQSETQAPKITVTSEDSSTINEYDPVPYYTATVTMMNTVPSLSTVIQVTILAPLCTPDLVPPADFSNSVTYNPYNPGLSTNFYDAFKAAGNGDCEFNFFIDLVTPESLTFEAVQPSFAVISAENQNLFTPTSTGMITVTPTENMVGTIYELQMLINGESESSPFTINVDVLPPECIPNPLDDGSAQTYFTLFFGETAHEITLDQFSNGDCAFDLEISDADDLHTAPLSYNIVQPQFEQTFAISTSIQTVTVPGKLQVTANNSDNIGEHTELKVTIVGTTSPVFQFTINIEPPPCTQATSIQLPTFDPLYSVQQGSLLDISLTDITQDGDCSYTLDLIVNGLAYGNFPVLLSLTQTTFDEVYSGYSASSMNVVGPAAGLIRISPTDLEHCNIPGESYDFVVKCTIANGITKQATFKVFIEGESCVEGAVLPTLDASYTFTQGVNEEYTIDLSSGTNGNCDFTYETVLSPSPVQLLVNVTQPDLEVVDARQPTIVQVTPTSQAQLVVTPFDISHIGSFTVTVRFAPSGSSTDFTLNIIAPVCVPDLTLVQPVNLELFADLQTPHIMNLRGADGDCQYSYQITEAHGGHVPALIELHQPTLLIQPEIPTIVYDSTPGQLVISPTFDWIGQHEVTLTLSSVQIPASTMQKTFTVKIVAPPCLPDLKAPVSFSVTITVGEEEQFVELSDFQNNNCSFELALIDLTGHSLDMFTLEQPIFAQVHHLVPEQFTVEANGKLWIASMAKDQIGFYSLILHATHLHDSVQSLVTIEVLREGTCDPDLQLPNLRDQVVQMGTQEISISLEGASSGSCRFTYELFTDEHQMADPSLFSLKQPTFTGEADDLTVNDPGSIIVTPDQVSHIGNHSIVLSIEGQDGSTGEVSFEIEVQPCEAINSSQEGTVDVLYVVGSGKKTQVIQTTNEKCPNSSFTFSFEESRPFLTVDSETLTLTIQTEQLEDSGVYSLMATEQDNGNFKTSVTLFQIYIDTEEVIAELALKLAATRGGVSGNSTVNDGEDQNGYPIFSPEFFKRKFGYVQRENTTPAPLTAQIYDITKAGNLTIVFNKPIILPPIELFIESKRQLQEVVLGRSDSPQRNRNYSLSQVLTIYLESSFYDDDSKEIEVLNYNLTRLTPTAFDVQILFNEPQSITQSRVEPDVIKVNFKMNDLFIDENDFQTFQEDSMLLEFPIVPQYSKERLEELEAIETVVETSMTTFSIGNLVLNSFLAFGLKYLWNMVTLLQFMIFMREWLVSLPDEANIFLKELRSLALLEFLQKYEIKDTVFGWFGIEQEQNPLKKGQSLFDKLAVILLAGIVIVFLVLLLLCLRVCVKKSPRAKRCFDSLKAKLLYNTFIRYVLLGTLKIQLTIGGTVFIGSVIPETLTLPAPETGLFVFGILVLTVMSLMPFLFGWVLYANRNTLSSANIKSKIGAMYFSLLPDRPYIGSYSVVFLMRRSLFVFAYFALYYYPSMQVQIMLYSTLLYICYIINMGFYESNSHRQIEIMNECILVGVCYHFVIFANPNFDIQIRHKLGLSTIILVSALLAVNGLVIVCVSISAIKRKLLLKKMKRLAEERHAEQRQKKLSSAVKNPNQLEAVVKINMVRQNEDTNIPIIIKSTKLRLKQEDQGEAGKLESFEDPVPVVCADLEKPAPIEAKLKGKKKKSLKMANIDTKLALQRPKPASTIQIKAKAPKLQSAIKSGGLGCVQMSYTMQTTDNSNVQKQRQLELPKQQKGAISQRKGGPKTKSKAKTKVNRARLPQSNAAGQSMRSHQDPNQIVKPKTKLQLENTRLMDDLIRMMEVQTLMLKNE